MASKTVMFTAVAGHGGNFGPFPSDKTLVFNAEITNIGGAYDSSSGIFKAPVPGAYCFTFSYHADKNERSGLTLIKNGTVIVEAFDNNDQEPLYADNATNTACLKLERGDKVFVRLPAGCQVSASGTSTTFTGFLIGGV